MDFVEHVAKRLLSDHGIATPRGIVVGTNWPQTDLARAMAVFEGRPVAVKAQVPAGGRGKAGGVVLTADPLSAITRLTGAKLGDHVVDTLLIEEQVDIAHELYLALAVDGSTGGPRLMFSPTGGVDIESSDTPLTTVGLSIGNPPSTDELAAALSGAGCPEPVDAVAQVARQLYDAFVAADAELLEINPLAITGSGRVVALDGKLSVDDSAAARQGDLAAMASTPPVSGLEAKAAENDLRFIELEGSVGVLANGAGLTMTTMDAIVHHGGQPANFLEIGGDAYTLAVPALEVVLANPKVRSLVVNFCGAFARCDVMTGGVIEAWKQLEPEVPVFFSIHGTGMDEARAMVRNELNMEPFEYMDDAIVAAVAAAAAKPAAPPDPAAPSSEGDTP